jgi:hypothetical protein
MTHHATGAGKVIVYSTGQLVRAGLYNFDIDWPEVKKEHKDWLKANVFDILAASGSITLKGQASRTGRSAHNMHLSVSRLVEVVTFLRSRITAPFNIRRVDAVGEFAAAGAGQFDDLEDEYYRSVIIAAWRRPEPPPPPPPPPFQLPCSYYDFWKRYNTGLKNAWVLSMASGSFEDRGGPVARVMPSFENFNMAMGAQGFTPAERERLWDSYNGEPGPNGGYDIINNLPREIERMEAQRRRDGCSGSNYDPGPLRQNPRRGHRDTEGFRS